MGIDKHGSKSGNYVGGFLQLFDWNAKSRKKLFSSKSDLPEKFKQKKRFDGNLPITRLQMLDEDEIAAQSSMKASSDYSYASSLTDEDLHGIRGPSVVARLMGLDSLPRSNAPDPISDSQSLPGSYYQSNNLDYRQDPQIMHSSRLIVQPHMEAKYQKAIQRPIEKFQTEVLPPKSAKPIPLTHHKLLSPIKSASTIPPRDAVHIMEAAARIIERGPQVRKPVLALAGSNSAPLRVKDLKEKAQAAKKPSKPSEMRGVKHVTRNSTNKSSSVDSISGRSFQDCEEISSGVKSKGKSISLALQAKANVQKREALNMCSSKTSASHAEANEFSPNMLFTSNTTIKKTMTNKSSSVLRQNNQKQNCIVDRGKLPLKSNLKGGKVVSGDLSSSKRRHSSRLVGSRKSGSDVKDDESNPSSCSSNRVTRKKRSIEGNYHSDNSQSANNLKRDKNGKIIKSGAIMDTRSSWDSDSGKEGNDVISFTFTAPMRSAEFQENCKNLPVDSPSKRIMLNSNGSKFSFLGHNIKGSDSLSTFLELQLRELAHMAEFSQQKSVAVSRESSSMLEDHKMEDQNHLEDPREIIADQEAMLLDKGTSGLNITEDQAFLSCRLPSPISVLEHTSFTESCNSTDSADSNHVTRGSNKWSSGNTDLSDEVSSTCATSVAKHENPRSRELDYVTEMLSNLELMFTDYAIGIASEMINPHLFDQLETSKKCFTGSGSTSRRLLFDCVSECVEMRCGRFAAGGYELWAKGVQVVKRKDRLAEDVYKEILSWSNMGDFMVDELVDSDMSSGPCGRWLSYEIQGFEVGMRIESRILNSLIDEVAADILYTKII